MELNRGLVEIARKQAGLLSPIKTAFFASWNENHPRIISGKKKEKILSLSLPLIKKVSFFLSSSLCCVVASKEEKLAWLVRPPLFFFPIRRTEGGRTKEEVLFSLNASEAETIGRLLDEEEEAEAVGEPLKRERERV